MAQKSVTWKLVERLTAVGTANAELAARIMVAMMDFILVDFWGSKSGYDRELMLTYPVRVS